MGGGVILMRNVVIINSAIIADDVIVKATAVRLFLRMMPVITQTQSRRN